MTALFPQQQASYVNYVCRLFSQLCKQDQDV